MLILLLTNHSLFISDSVAKMKLILTTLAFYTVLFYLFLQLNFELISHNFGLRDQSLINIKNLYASSSISILVIVVLLASHIARLLYLARPRSARVATIFTEAALILVLLSVVMVLVNDIA